MASKQGHCRIIARCLLTLLSIASNEFPIIGTLNDSAPLFLRVLAIPILIPWVEQAMRGVMQSLEVMG